MTRHDLVAGRSDEPRRWRGDRGTAIITASVLLFALTAAGILYLSRDVNRVVTHRSAAQSVAFQAARAGAQQVDVVAIRDSVVGGAVLDPVAAQREARAVGGRMLAAQGLEGAISEASIVGDTVTVSVVVFDPHGDVVATASVQAQVGS